MTASDEIVIGMAAMPHRATNLARSLPGLLRQCDRLCLHMNGAESAAPFLPAALLANPRLRLSASCANLGDAAKFLGAPAARGYFLSVDDDFIYPDDYVRGMIAKLESLGRRTAACVYGAVFDATLPVRGLYHRMVFHAPFEPLAAPERVLLPGTGTLCIHLPSFRVAPEDCRTPNMADFWVGFKAAREGVPVYAVDRPANWLVPLPGGNESITQRLPMSLIEREVERGLPFLGVAWASLCGGVAEAPPLVSVVALTRDAPRALGRALDSVCSQDYPSVEVVVVNLGHTDISGVLALRSARMSIRIVDGGRDRNLADALNAGIRAARGEFLAFMEDMDRFLPHHLGVLTTLLRSRRCEAAYTGVMSLPMRLSGGQLAPAGAPFKHWTAWDPSRLQENPDMIPLCSMMMRRAVWEQIGGFDPGSREPWAFQVRLAKRGALAGFSRPTVERLHIAREEPAEVEACAAV